MINFLKAVWQKTCQIASWIKEGFFDAVETSAYFVSMVLAKAGGLASIGSRRLVHWLDRGAAWLTGVVANAAYNLLVGIIQTVRYARTGFIYAAVTVHNLFTTALLVLQTPYLFTVSRPLLKETWNDQIRRLFFRDGVSASVSVAEVTWAHLRERQATRQAARNEAAQHAAQQAVHEAAQAPKGHPTPKQKKKRPKKFADALQAAAAPVVDPAPAAA